MKPDLARRMAAEWLGTLFLLATVVGSGIMAERLVGGNQAIALLANTLATGTMLTVLILIFGPISGAHFNPLVSLVFAARGEGSWKESFAYIPMQFLGGFCGVWLAHVMFALPVLQISVKARDGWSMGVSEFVASFGLIATILGVGRFRADTVPAAVGLYIAAAYWFTASTSFANPAVTVARSFTDTFSGIAPASVPLFVAAQLLAAAVAVPLWGWFLNKQPPTNLPG